MRSRIFWFSFIMFSASCKSTGNRTQLAAELPFAGCSANRDACAKIPKTFWSIPQNQAQFTGLPRAIRDIAVDGGTIYLATNQGLAISREGITRWKTRTMANGLGDLLINEVAADGSDIFATHPSGMSISRDGGESWTWLSKAQGFTSKECKGVHVESPRVYVACRNNLYLSQDKGRTWETAKDSLSLGNAVMAVDKDQMYAGQSQLLKSIDQGASWTRVENFPLQNLKQIERDGPNIYAMDIGGQLVISRDQAQSWTQARYNDGRVIKDARSLSSSEGRLVLATSSEGLIASKDAGASWTANLNPSPADSSPSPIEKVLVKGSGLYISTGRGLEYLPTLGESWLKAPYDSGLLALPLIGVHSSQRWLAVASPDGISLSQDAGKSWTFKAVNAEGKPALISSVSVAGQTIFAGGKGLFVSKDAGETWESLFSPTNRPFVNAIFVAENKVYAATEVGVGIWMDGKQDFKTGSGATALADSRVNDIHVDESGTIFAATRGGLSISRDGGTTWDTPLKAASLSEGYSAVTGFQNRIFAGGPSNFEVSEDGGQSWKSGDINGQSIKDIATDGNNVWLATEQGLVVSVDQGRSWNALEVKGLGAGSVSRVHVDGTAVMLILQQQLLIGNSARDFQPE